MKPEQRARRKIDEQLQAAGWVVQSRDEANLGAARGVAVGEFPLTTGFADYMLFVDKRPIGVVEAKAAGKTLSGVELQTDRYSQGLPPLLKPRAWHAPLPFLYQSTGVETFFTDVRDPEPRSRRVFTFHRPETLAERAGEYGRSGGTPPLRARLRQMPPLITTGLWAAQIEAVRNLEVSFAADRPRALIQMATGSGKTYTAVTSIYRLIKHAKAHRVLFMVDRTDLEEFVACYHPANRHDRTPTWSEETTPGASPDGRWRAFSYEELTARDKVNLDIFWLRDESLEETANLPDPDILAAEIVDDLEAALEQFRAIAEDLEEPAGDEVAGMRSDGP